MKLHLLVVVLSCAAIKAGAQGTVSFRNFVATTVPAVDAPVYLDYIGGPRLNGGNPLWRAALIGGPTTATPTSVSGLGTLQMMYNPAATTVTWVNFSSGSTPPAADGYVNVGSAAARAVPGVDTGGTALIQMVAWEGDYTTWAEAYTAWLAGMPDARVGWSNPLTLTLFYPGPFPVYLWGLNPFAITLVPEPGEFALGGLGIAALLFFRRYVG